jgi:3-oxoadipate enol-lactonase / 4-carboxymuconolactone decarboxylase
VWQRPGFDDRTRRLLALTALAALGRWDEFRMHIRAGLEHELEPCDLEETLFQLAIYAGIPAANSGFQIAAEIMERA